MKRLFVWISFLVPLVVLFRPIFSSISLSLGDAPYFYKSFEWFLSEPHAWTTRGISLGGINQFIWIWPYMHLAGFLEKFMSLNSAVLIRLLFYVPSLILAPWGAYKLAREHSVSSIGSYFAVFLSIFNTYFLVIFDGGQVGIVLSYAIFPWAFLYLSRYLRIETISKASFLKSLVVLCILTIADPRVAILCIGVSTLTNLKIKRLLLLAIPWVLLNSYWVYPLLSLHTSQSPTGTEIQSTSFLNGLFLYAPHWYENIYGLVTYPTILFSTFLILIVFNLFTTYKNNRKLLILFLFLVFLIKGSTSPFGGMYILLQKFPFGSAFRDSTKFFIPAIYIAGILIGFSVDYITKKANLKLAFVALYVLFLIPFYPAFLGRMNFVLSGHESDTKLPSVNQFIMDSNTVDRTAWFPEKNPRSIETPTHESIDAKELVNLRFFAQLNTGTEDRFNFLNQPQSDWWFDLLAIKNLVFTDNPREIKLTKTEQEDKDRLLQLLPQLKYLTKTNLETSTYQNSNYVPKLYGVEKAFVVIGSDSIYNKFLANDKNFKPYNHAFLFTDDGKWNPKILEEYATTSAVLVNNTPDKNALAMSFLQTNFVSAKEAQTSQFASYTSDQYLQYKYELLIRKFIYDDFDFNKGIAFSSQTGEELVFKTKIYSTGDYTIAVRGMNEKGKEGMHVSVDGNPLFTTTTSDHFIWNVGNTYLTSGSHTISIKNPDGLQVFNVLSVTPKADFLKAQTAADNMYKNYLSYTPDTIPADLLKTVWKPITAEEAGTNKYLLTPDTNIRWIIWTNNYDNKWRLTRDFVNYTSLPGYSAINTFYRRPEWNQMTLEFEGQESVRFGIYMSIISILILAVIMLWI